MSPSEVIQGPRTFPISVREGGVGNSVDDEKLRLIPAERQSCRLTKCIAAPGMFGDALRHANLQLRRQKASDRSETGVRPRSGPKEGQGPHPLNLGMRAI